MEDRTFAVVASVCLLCWLLSRERRVPPLLRLWLSRAAFAGIAIGLVIAVGATLTHFLSG